MKKFPSKKQWGNFFKVLTRKERFAFFLFLVLFLSSSFFLLRALYYQNTKVQPMSGGTHIEGVIGQPRFINPIYSAVSDVDQDLTELVFSGLMKYNGQGQIVPDLAQEYEIREEGKVYLIYLKDNLFWSDGQPLTANDIIFTIETIQNSDFKSPLMANWVGVDVEKISDSVVKFKLRNPYNSFLENLTQKIIPEHLWKNISAQTFPLAIHNLKPVGSGPYKLKTLEQNIEGKIISLELVKNQKYHGKTPYISQISFRFFDNEEDLIRSYQKGEIKGFSLTSAKYTARTNISQWTSLYDFSLPRYFALFFNPEKAKILTDQNVRQALNYGTDKEAIVAQVFSGYGQVVHSPILPEIYGFEPPKKIYSLDVAKAKELLEKAGFLLQADGKRIKVLKKEPAFQFKTELKEGSKGKEVENLQKCLANPLVGGPEVYPEGQITGKFDSLTKKAVIRFQEKYAKDILEPYDLKKGTGIVSKATRNKLNALCFPPSSENLSLKFSLSTVNQPGMIAVAEILKKQWQELGVEIEIKSFDISTLEKEVIKPRDYDLLLFGEVLKTMPDPFPFWHSIQKKDPGLNLAIYQNKEADKLLEEARQTQNQQERKEKLEEFQNILIEDAPAVFLYNPTYLYLVSKEVKGIDAKLLPDPAKRFCDIENWYIQTRRVWK